MKRITFLLLSMVCFVSCNNVSKESLQQDTTTIEAMVDPSWFALIKAFQGTYNALNTHTQVSIVDTTEGFAIQSFLKGNSPLVFVSHPLDSSIMAALKLQNKFIRVDTIGYDAIACIVPKSMNIDSLSVDDLKNIFLGNDGRKIETVYLNGAGTSVIAYLETWCGKPNSKKHLYAMGNDAQIIEKISQSNQAMAFVSSKSFSNLASKQTLSNYNKVKLLPIYQKGGIPYFPDQSNLYEGLYPLKRTLYALLYDRVDGLGTAFVNFILSERGQRLILKEGLLPHHMPSRKVSLE